MSLLDTLNAIETNIETILGTTLGYLLEDLSGDDIDTTTLAQLFSERMVILDEEEISPEYADRDYLVVTKSEATTPDAARTKANTIIAALRGAFTIAALNSGSLSVSQPVASITGFTFSPYWHENKTLYQEFRFTVNFNTE